LGFFFPANGGQLLGQDVALLCRPGCSKPVLLTLLLDGPDSLLRSLVLLLGLLYVQKQPAFPLPVLRDYLLQLPAVAFGLVLARLAHHLQQLLPLLVVLLLLLSLGLVCFSQLGAKSARFTHTLLQLRLHFGQLGLQRLCLFSSCLGRLFYCVEAGLVFVDEPSALLEPLLAQGDCLFALLLLVLDSAPQLLVLLSLGADLIYEQHFLLKQLLVRLCSGYRLADVLQKLLGGQHSLQRL
jgi:hypothetical protein